METHSAAPVMLQLNVFRRPMTSTRNALAKFPDSQNTTHTTLTPQNQRMT
jgi:hypothetical protein